MCSYAESILNHRRALDMLKSRPRAVSARGARRRKLYCERRQGSLSKAVDQ